MFGSSAIRVVHQSPSNLQILEPGYAAGYFLIAAGALWLIVAYFLFSAPRPRPLVMAFLLLPPLVLIVGGLVAVTWETRTELSRDTNKVTVVGRVLGLPLRRVEVPLSRIRYAEVITVHVARNILLHLDSGSVIRIGNNTDRAGHYEVAHAVNEFLHRQPATI